MVTTALPAAADDQSIFATGAIGGVAPSARWDAQQAQKTRGLPYGGYPQYSDYAQYGEPAQSNGSTQAICTYSGGPKSPTAWTCQ